MLLGFDLQTIGITRAAIPLLSIPFLGLQSWHCILMCGPQFALKNRAEKNSFMTGKLVSYSITAAAFGFFGERLLVMSEIRAFGAIAFVVYLFLTLLLVATWLGKLKNFSYLTYLQIGKATSRSSLVQGLLSIGLPCGLLLQMLNLAVLSKSTLGGLLIGMGMASISGLSLWFSSKAIFKAFRKFEKFQMITNALVLLAILFSLYSFGQIVFGDEATINPEKLLCL